MDEINGEALKPVDPMVWSPELYGEIIPLEVPWSVDYIYGAGVVLPPEDYSWLVAVLVTIATLLFFLFLGAVTFKKRYQGKRLFKGAFKELSIKVKLNGKEIKSEQHKPDDKPRENTKPEDKPDQQKFEDKTKDKSEDRSEDKSEDKSEGRPEDKIKDRLEDKIKDRLEDKTESETEDKRKENIQFENDEEFENIENNVELQEQRKSRKQKKNINIRTHEGGNGDNRENRGKH